MSDAISKLRGLANDIKAKEEELRSYFIDLEQQLKDAAGGHSIQGQSENCILESYGDDDAYYGYLFFGNDGLAVAYRTREQDMHLALEENEPWDSRYTLQPLDKCSPVWLRALSAPNTVETLLTNINTKLEQELSSTSAGIQTLSATVNLPLRGLDAGLIEAARKLDFGAVIQQWHDAQSALGVDPPDATTRASSLIETLCKHILHTKGKTLPASETIQGLYGAASRSLSISPEQQRSSDMRAIAGGINTLVIGIGALRTHSGTAHGRGPSNTPITFSQARLAVNAAGVVATFLMDALAADNASSTAPQVKP
jgi:hypothetical protein